MFPMLPLPAFPVFIAITACVIQTMEVSDHGSATDGGPKLNSIVLFETTHSHYCTGPLVRINRLPTVLIPSDCFLEILLEPGIIAVTYGDKTIEVDFSSTPMENENADLIAMHLPENASVQPVLMTWTVAGPGDHGTVGKWVQDELYLKQAHVVRPSFCNIRAPRFVQHLCVKDEDGEKSDAGLGNPFFIEQDGKQVLAGVHIGYDNATGNNVYVPVHQTMVFKVSNM